MQKRNTKFVINLLMVSNLSLLGTSLGAITLKETVAEVII